jgi:uncharacterized pyridoxal phosphate-containing UPF0001 family protein
MASNVNSERQIKKEFQSLIKFNVQCSKFKTENIALNILSFGMSSDYKLAIDEGSNMIRVGSSIFGERNYNL